MNFAGRDLSILSLRKVHVIISSPAAGLQPVTAQQGIKDFQIRVDIASRQQPAGYILFSTALTEPEDVHGQRSEYSQIQSRQPSKPSTNLASTSQYIAPPVQGCAQSSPVQRCRRKAVGVAGLSGTCKAYGPVRLHMHACLGIRRYPKQPIMLIMASSESPFLVISGLFTRWKPLATKRVWNGLWHFLCSMLVV